jgi:hypothetical protein
MKSLKESLLADIEDTLNNGDTTIKKFEIVGHMFTMSRGIASTKAAAVFSANALKKLTKDLDYINDNIRPEKVIFDSKNKCNIFLNWFENLSFDELGINILKYKDFSSLDFQKALTKSLRELCKKNSIFNSPDKVDLYVLNARDYDSDALFEIFISNRTSFSASSMMKFVYKEKK